MKTPGANVDIKSCWLAYIVVLMSLCPAANAEPYLAVFKGMQCSSCHSNPAGGGKRNVYGNVFAQAEWPAQRIGDPKAALWTGEVFEWLSIGGDLRAGFESVDVPNVPTDSEFAVNRGTAYLELSLIPNRLSVYVDQQFAPDSIENRELKIRLRTADGRFQLAAGQFILPYGLRLQDDSAFVRQATGVNFNIPDRGVQFAYEAGPWSTQISVTNGTGAGPVLDSGDQVSFVANYVRPLWRAGVSFNSNNSDAGDRQMQNAFVGIRTGPVMWLSELDFIADDLPDGSSQHAIAGLIEANWLFRKGHNVKVSYDYLDPNDGISEDHQVRWSVLWEYTPIQFLQARFGARIYDGIPQVEFQNRNELFAELHGFF